MSMPQKIEEFVGNAKLKTCLTGRLALGRIKHPNLLIQGDPGSGKTSMAEVFFRQLLDDPDVGREDNDYMQIILEQQLYRFIRINGSLDRKDRLIAKNQDAVWTGADHAYVLIDEIGELWANKLDAVLRPMLDAPDVSVIATAQDFKGLEKSAEDDAARKRWQALWRRFPIQHHTQLPTVGELTVFLAKELVRRGMTLLDGPATLRVLVLKFNCNPSLCLNVIERVVSEGRTTLTAEDVSEA